MSSLRDATRSLLPRRGTMSFAYAGLIGSIKPRQKENFPHVRIVSRKEGKFNKGKAYTFSAFCLLPSALCLATINSVAAQQANPVCQPPGAGEYLLLVISPTAENQRQLRNALPNEIKSSVCQYLQDTVTRISGFNKIDDANRWARYINNIVGLSAIITTRPADQQPQQPQTLTYNPQTLKEGYAVLVDYFNRPELANSVQQVVGGNVGFASYGQRPYLLAVYTTNQQEAYNTLQKLNERGFISYLVDSRKVVLLRSAVRL